MSECALDNLIPPSIAFILYGIATETSVAHLFAAGILPGLVLGGIFAIYIYLYSVQGRTSTSAQKFSWSEFLAASREGIWPLGAIVVIFGGIYSGVFSPTEAAGVSCVYAIFVAMVIYREVDLQRPVPERGAHAVPHRHVLPDRVGRRHVRLAADHQRRGGHAVGRRSRHCMRRPGSILLMINVFLLVVGCFLDTGTALLVLSPLLLPIAKQIGVDPIHFGVIVVMNLTIGGFHPPFGLNIFVFQAMFKTPSNVLYPGLIPFVALAIVWR